MNTKKFIPCIYLYQKQALEGPDKGRSGLGIDPVELAGFYARSEEHTSELQSPS